MLTATNPLIGSRSWLLPTFILLLASIPGSAQQIEAEFRVKNDWRSGFVGEIELTNRGSAPIAGWTLEFDLGGNLVTLWNGRHTRNATHYTVNDLGWNGRLAPGGSAVFGFQISFTGERPEPTHCIFNGRACEFGGDVENPEPPPPPPPPLHLLRRRQPRAT